MKKICENQRKLHESCFKNIGWVFCPSDTKLSLGEMYTEFRNQQAKAEMRKNSDKSELVSPSFELSTRISDFSSLPVCQEKEKRFTEEIILATAKAVPVLEQLDSGDASTNIMKAWDKTSAFKKSSMQIVEDHLLEKVFIRRLYGVLYLYNGKYYEPLSAADYSILLRRESDEKIISLLKNYRQFKDGCEFLLSNPDIEFKDYNKESVKYKTVIAFENTLLDAETGKTYRHHPDYPIIFGVDSFYKKHPDDTPYWDYFIESVSQGDKKIKTLIHEMIGYLLLQGNDGKCFFVLASAPNSGKSLFGDFIESFFQDEYVSHIAIDNFGKRFAMGSLWKTVLNVSMDLPQSTLTTDTVSQVKTLTGDSKIAAEEKYLPISTALNRCKFVFGTNFQLSISAPDGAFWDRVIVVPFLYEVPRKDRQTDLLAHLIEEKDDILSKCIPYVRKLIHRNYEFTMPEDSVSMKNAWLGNTGDAIGKFFSQCCEFSDNSEGIPVRKLYGHFLDYCDKNGFHPGVEDDRNFSKQVKKRYPEIEQKKCRIQDAKNPVSVFANVSYYPYES